MSDTTIRRVQAIAKHLASLPTDTIEMYINDAKAEVARYNLTDALLIERLQRYYAAHLATLDRPRPSSQKAADLQLTYQRAEGRELQSTEYGQEFSRLLQQAQGGYLKVM